LSGKHEAPRTTPETKNIDAFERGAARRSKAKTRGASREKDGGTMEMLERCGNKETEEDVDPRRVNKGRWEDAGRQGHKGAAREENITSKRHTNDGEEFHCFYGRVCWYLELFSCEA